MKQMEKKMAPLAFLCGLLVSFLTSSNAIADIYKYQDRSGQILLTDRLQDRCSLSGKYVLLRVFHFGYPSPSESKGSPSSISPPLHSSTTRQTKSLTTEQLIAAAFSGNSGKVQALLTAGAGVNAKAEDGKTALMAASEKGHAKIIQALLTAGADVNAKDKGS